MIYILLSVFGCLAWFISTVAAGGAATFLVPVIGLLLGAQFVAPVISIASLIANPTRVLFFRPDIHWDLIKYLIPGTVTGALVGAWLFTTLEIQWLQIIMGVFVVSYVIQQRFSRIRLGIAVKLWWFFPLGIFIAGMSGLVGATGPVLNPFLLSCGLRKEQIVATKAVNSVIMQISKLSMYGLLGALSLNIGLYGLMLGSGAICGVWLARKHLVKINQRQFELYVHILLIVSGAIMIVSAINH